MSPMFHGIQQAKENRDGHFHFAVRGFFLHIDHMYFGVRAADAPPWAGSWLDRTFSQACGKLADTFGKLHLAAGLFGQAHRDIGEFKDAREHEKYSRHSQAIKTVPIYLDSILFYLRIFADCLANLTPRLYGRQGRNIAWRSFRDQRKWFTSKCPTFDPTYADILNQHTTWFETLSGGPPGEGLREEIVHYRGTMQLSYTVDTPAEETQVAAGLIGDYGWICDNVLPVLTQLVFELFVFLDHFVSHFNTVVGEQIGRTPLDLNNPHDTEYFRLTKPLVLDSFWLYPSVER